MHRVLRQNSPERLWRTVCELRRQTEYYEIKAKLWKERFRELQYSPWKRVKAWFR
jgi:hypothetical protein